MIYEFIWFVILYALSTQVQERKLEQEWLPALCRTTSKHTVCVFSQVPIILLFREVGRGDPPLTWPDPPNHEPPDLPPTADIEAPDPG